MIPDFFIVGAPKCGTTSLAAWLEGHPQVYLPAKEPGYFSQDIFPLGKNLEDYLSLYRKAPPGAVVGEATPKYLYSPVGLQEISSLNPFAKIIVVLRPPAELVASMHAQMIKEGNEDEPDLSKAWRLADARRSGLQLPRLCRSSALLDYPMWGAVGTACKNLLSVFKRENVLILLLEDIRRDPAAAYQSVLNHLCLYNDGRNYFPVMNQRKHYKSIRLHHQVLSLKRRYYPLYQHISAAFGGRGTGVIKLIERFNVTDRKTLASQGYRAEFLTYLYEYFRSEVELLESLTKKDLRHWYSASERGE